MTLERAERNLVDQVVCTYLRRSRWAHVIVEDLRQEAYLAIEQARGRYNPEKGEWYGYAYRAAWLALASFLVAEASPVTRREKGAPNTGRRVSDSFLGAFEMATMSAGNTHNCNGGSVVNSVLLSLQHPSTEETFSEFEWNAVVRERVAVVCRGDLDLVRILMEETTPAEVATARGVPVSRIYNAVAGARARLSDDLELYSLMNAKNGVHMGESGGERE